MAPFAPREAIDFAGFMRIVRFVRALLFIFAFSTVLSSVRGNEMDELYGFFSDYCFKCHDADVQKGDLRLDEMVDAPDFIRDREAWLSILEQIETREMPPKDPLPDEKAYAHWEEVLHEKVNDIDWEKYKHPGHVTIPRLTRAEYNNTIRDLFGMDTNPGRNFSPDAEGRTGFTNDRDNLFVTGTDLEKYFEAADLTIEALHSFSKEPISWFRESEKMFMTESLTKPSKFDEDSVGHILTSGQKTLYESVELPAYGFYRVTIRGKSTTYGPAKALFRMDDVLVGELRVDGRELQEDSATFFMTPGSHQVTLNVKLPPRELKKKGKDKESDPQYTVLPENANEIIGKESVKRSPELEMPEEPSGELRKLVLDWNRNEKGVQRAYEWLRLLGENGDPNQHARFKGYVAERLVPLEELKPKLAKEMGVSVKQFEKQYAEANQEALKDREKLLAIENPIVAQKRGFIGVDWIKVEGPVLPSDLDNPELLDEAVKAVVEGKGWKKWFPDFVSRAFRRPVPETEMEKYLTFYQTIRDEGGSHGEAAGAAVSAVLVSPSFLYRAEELPAKPGDEVMELTDHQLASRLSYFLWQSTPDRELRKLADAGKLSEEGEINRQVKRMLNDPKADALFSTFPGQWLGYESLGISVIPDGTRFPEFDAELAEAMKAETAMWFQRILATDKSLFELLSSDHTYLNYRLAAHYGIPDVRGEELQLVSLNEEEQQRRGGILGMGSVLAATSTPVRTSPVLRGVFVMERILGDEPGDPPADAGELPGNAGNRGKTLKEELEIHRDRADCAVCHDKIDPLGFGLEGFDVIGRWRGDKVKLDMEGVLPDGTTFTGVAGLRTYLTENRSEDFVRHLAERLLSYGLGRELQFYDEPAVLEICEKVAANEYGGTFLVQAIVDSYPFRHQHAQTEIELHPTKE